MKRGRSPSRNQSEFSRIITLFHGDHMNGINHVRVDDLIDGLSGFYGRNSQRTSHLLFNCVCRQIRIEAHRSAQEVVRIEKSQGQIRIGNRRLGTASTVAGWSRFSSSRPWADLQDAASI